MLATSFAEAAGVAGRQKWGLVLSSSARVSQVTYQTVVGVRYPELVTFNGTNWNFGKFVPPERPQRGGFLPIFWDVPRADTHAVEDIGAVVDWLTERCDFRADAKSSLAVLHNRNDMTNLFRASNWVSSSQDSIVPRGVTTCAGMTAHTVILAQTRVGFLTGPRKKYFLALPEDEQLAAHEIDTDSDKDESIVVTSDSDGSESASDSEQNDPPSSLASDAEQYERMQASYVAVGRDFHDQEDLIGPEYSKLQRLELVPERWPLARLSFSLLKCVDHLDRVLAGCCWEVHATRADPTESLPSLHQVSKSLTMMLAIYLAKEVAAILRAILTHDTKKLYDESTVHLLCSNYWIQPIYQELLHSSSRYNATRAGERNRPSSGLARVAAHPRPPKKRKPSASGTRFCDWRGGICYADTLQVWFTAHWAPVVLHQLQQKEDSYRAAHPSWMDQAEAPDDIKKQWQEARANRQMQFKVGNYRDGDKESNIRMLTGTTKADWIQLPVERYLAALPTLKQGVISGVFRHKGAAPWASTRAEKLQLSAFITSGIQESTPCQLCGLMCPCWELTICAE